MVAAPWGAKQKPRSAGSPALPLHHAPPPPPPFPPPSNQPLTASGSTTVTSRRRRRVNASDRRRYALPTTVTSDGYDYVHDSTGAAVPASYDASAAETLKDDVESSLRSKRSLSPTQGSPLDGGKMEEAPESPRLLPRPATLSDFCIHDAEYQDVLLRRRRGRVVRLVERSGGGGRRRRNVGLGLDGIVSADNCARGCAGLSFVGVLFLIFVGVLIERQPLYIKGVPLRSGSSLQRWQEQRQMLQQQQQRGHQRGHQLGRGGEGEKISLGDDLTDVQDSSVNEVTAKDRERGRLPSFGKENVHSAVGRSQAGYDGALLGDDLTDTAGAAVSAGRSASEAGKVGELAGGLAGARRRRRGRGDGSAAAAGSTRRAGQDAKKKRRTQKHEQRRSYYGAGSGGQQHQQQQEEEGGKRRMRTESSNAFKASAAYFVTMVLSLIYIQIQGNDIDLGLGVALQQMTFRLRRNIARALQSYRRRHYVDIPDTHSTTPTIHVFDQGEGGYQRNFTFELWRRVTRIGGMMGSGDGKKKDR